MNLQQATTPASARPRGKIPTPQDVARDCLRSSKGDRERAYELFRRQLVRHGLDVVLASIDPWLRAIIQPMIESGTRSVIGDVQVGEFKVSLVGRRDQSADAKAGAALRAAITSIVERDWLQCRLFGGRKTYAESTKDDFLSSATQRERRAAGHTRRAKAERTIAAKIGAGQVCRDVLDSKAVAQIVRMAR